MNDNQQFHRAQRANNAGDPEIHMDSMDLFAEELPEHSDYFTASTLACFSTGACSCVYSTAATLTTKACTSEN